MDGDSEDADDTEEDEEGDPNEGEDGTSDPFFFTEFEIWRVARNEFLFFRPGRFRPFFSVIGHT